MKERRYPVGKKEVVREGGSKNEGPKAELSNQLNRSRGEKLATASKSA